jgi:molybdenum cofactor biosynthesis protein B
LSAEQHRQYAPTRLGFALITVSDSRTPETDTSGRTMRERIEAAGHSVASATIVPDEIPAVRAALLAALGVDGVDVVAVSGGTGFSPRDVTIEAATPLFERPIEGFGELFRMLSFSDVGPAAMLSRAAAGLVQGRAIFLLPGSPKAVALALDRLILPEAGHLLGQARRVG